jgi:hypothetical protein
VELAAFALWAGAALQADSTGTVTSVAAISGNHES